MRNEKGLSLSLLSEEVLITRMMSDEWLRLTLTDVNCNDPFLLREYFRLILQSIQLLLPRQHTNLLPTLDSNHSVTVQYYSWAIQHDVEWSSEPVHHVCYTLSLSVLNGGRHLVWQSTNLCWCKQGDPWCRGVVTPRPITDWLTYWLTEWLSPITV